MILQESTLEKKQFNSLTEWAEQFGFMQYVDEDFLDITLDQIDVMLKEAGIAKVYGIVNQDDTPNTVEITLRLK
jgi:hypothetical protein